MAALTTTSTGARAPPPEARPRAAGSNEPGRWHTHPVTGRKPSPPVLAALVVAHLVVTTIVWRDIRRRPDDQVRGNKWFWRVVVAANMGNSLAYVLLGRKRAGRPVAV